MKRPRRTLKSLPIDEQKLLRFIREADLKYFTLKELKVNLDFQINDLQNSVENLAVKGHINRIEKGKYCVPEFRNEFVIGNILMPNGAVAYWTALHWHNLTEQIPNIVYIQSPKPKRDTIVFGVKYKFVKIKFSKFGGYETKGYGREKFAITDVEKTLIDSFDLPQYTPDFDSLIKAVASVNLDEQKLIRYSEIADNLSAIKRLGAIIETINSKLYPRYINYAIKKVNPRYIKLEPIGLDEGPFCERWRVRLNMTKDEIMTIAMQEY